jgi:hypothetical protein
MRQDARARRIAAAVIVAAVLGLAAAPTPAAAATDAPTATQLVKKLVHAGVCTQVLVVDAGAHEVKCRTDVHFRLPIRIYAYAARGRFLKALHHEIDETCALADQLPSTAGVNSFDLVVGATWFATAEPILHKKIVKQIDGKVKTYTCGGSKPPSSLPVDSLPVD